MANLKNHHPSNVPGALFTDLSCINCGTCYHLGPSLFHEHIDDKSVVMKQPEDEEEWIKAKRAILSCPTNSIGVHEAPEFFKALDPGLPLLIEDNVFYMGYTSRHSFGATTYLIVRPDGNVLIDSPKFHPWAVKEIEKRGGVKYMILSHQDDVADHKKFHEHFGCERYIHRDDVNNDTKNCENILDGNGPFQIGPEIKIISTPGHTKGHITINYKDKFLFTGDHLFVDQKEGKISASRGVCWFSWSEQIKSVEKLLTEKFEWVLPGHDGWMKFSRDESHQKLRELIQDMKTG